ncbi:MAG TPA: hypothetical protein VGE98_16205 [Thermoanaerobaculia bacterium]
MDLSNVIHPLEPLLLCHLLPAFVGGLILISYRSRTDKYRGKTAYTKAFLDLVGATLVGIVFGPGVSSWFSIEIPKDPTAVADIVWQLPKWLTWRWAISAIVGCSWMSVLAVGKEGITRSARAMIDKYLRKGGD